MKGVYHGMVRRTPISPDVDLSDPAIAVLYLSDRDESIITIVDSKYYDELNKFKWSHYDYGGKQYAKRTKRKDERGPHSIYLHRWIAQKYLPPPASPLHILVDHTRGYSLDNREEFLRWATPQENARNLYGMWWEQRDFLRSLTEPTPDDLILSRHLDKVGR